ncbi:MAG TPA: serine hydrolase domain-containing protein [Longimicrobium sp.]|nr:serine hydrolase domain-containing protein [Longimicrobium sp.]
MQLRLSTLLAAAVLAAAPARAQSPAPPVSQDELVRRLAATLDSLSARDEFSGVVVLARGGTPVWERAYGMADREARRPNDVETAFNLGSINKAFTQIAVRQLEAAGKIQLDSTLAFHWPDYPNQEVARRVTIRQLLQHRSGIGGNIFGDPPGGSRASIRRLRDFLPLFVDEPLQFDPGSSQRYSNAGYVVLGLLVERLSGEDYYDYVRRHVYQPAGMTRTAHFAVDTLPPNTAIGYTRGGPGSAGDGPLRRNTQELPGRGSSAGGGYSTAHDLMRFVQALRERKIPNGPPAGIGIAGGSGGINGVVEGDLPGGYDLIVLANLDPPAAERIARTVRGWLGAADDGPGQQRRPGS